MTFDDLKSALENAIDAGEIYNVDFNKLKCVAHSRQSGIISELGTIQNIFLDIPYDSRSKSDRDLYYGIGEATILRFPSKNLVRTLDNNQSDMANSVRKVITKWAPICEMFKTLKPMIIKGRKPSGSTPMRTLENTGTCACCGKNIKMNDEGKLVDHGYTTERGYRNGQCIGVNKQPLEVSDEGLLAMATALIHTISHEQIGLVNQTSKLRKSSNMDEVATINTAIHHITTTIRWATEDYNETINRISEWKPLPLPKGV